MRKYFKLGMALALSVAMLLTSCKKEEVNDNGYDNGNTENPGGGSGGGNEGELTPNQDYPSTAVVLPQAVTDIDGNSYDAVQIGNQVWMAENLRTTRYADGTVIPMGSTYSTTDPYRYAPGSGQSNEENMDNVSRYGYLYNWPAVMHGESSSNANPSGVQGICPDGWHVPSNAEWKAMEKHVGYQTSFLCDGDNTHVAKALAYTSGWENTSVSCTPGNNPSENNATGFSALPAGSYLYINSNYNCYSAFGVNATFRSATNGTVDGCDYGCGIGFDVPTISTSNNYKKSLGGAVRCVRD